MNIDKSYTLVKNLANKDQKGFLTSDEFNLYAERAQMEVFMQRYGNPHEYQVGVPIPRMAYDMTQKIHDDLRPFIKQKTLNIDKTGKVAYPTDYVHPSSFRYKYYKGQEGEEVKVKVMSDDKIAGRLSSSIVRPTKRYPICVLYNDHIKFYPKNLAGVTLTYLRQPSAPKWAFTIVNNREVYDPNNSVDFEFPDDVHNEICVKILSYFGIRLREGELIQYAENKAEKGI